MNLWTSSLEEDPLEGIDLQALLALDPEEVQLSAEELSELEERLRPYRTRVTYADLLIEVD